MADEPNVFTRLRAGLQKTRQTLRAQVATLFGSGPLDAATLDGLEEALLLADAGVPGGRLPGELKQRLRVARPARMRDWNLECAAWAAAARRWTGEELDRAIALAAVADRQLKSTTVSDERGILTSMLLSFPEARAAA